MYSAVGSGREWSGPPLDCYYATAALMIGFYVAHWEKYITGTLYMPWAYDLGEVVREGMGGVYRGCVYGVSE